VPATALALTTHFAVHDGLRAAIAVAGYAARQAWAEDAPAAPVALDRAAQTLRADLLALGAAGGTVESVTDREVHGTRPDVSPGPRTGRFRP